METERAGINEIKKMGRKDMNKRKMSRVVNSKLKQKGGFTASHHF